MTKPPTGGFFIYHCQYRECMRTSCRPTACDEKGITMAWKPWYEQVAEMNNQHEREEFIKGVFGFRPTEKRPIVAGLILASTAAYVAGGIKTVSKAKKKK